MFLQYCFTSLLKHLDIETYLAQLLRYAGVARWYVTMSLRRGAGQKRTNFQSGKGQKSDHFWWILGIFTPFWWVLGILGEFWVFSCISGAFVAFLPFWWIRGTVVQHRPRQVDFLLYLQRVFKLSEHRLRSRECQISKILVDFCDSGWFLWILIDFC